MMVVRCWSRIVTHRGEPNHIKADDKTFCGINVLLGYYDFEFDNNLDHINCLRCRRTKVFKELALLGKNQGTLDPPSREQ
jgi:hypothetical protein